MKGGRNLIKTLLIIFVPILIYFVTGGVTSKERKGNVNIYCIDILDMSDIYIYNRYVDAVTKYPNIQRRATLPSCNQVSQQPGNLQKSLSNFLSLSARCDPGSIGSPPPPLSVSDMTDRAPKLNSCIHRISPSSPASTNDGWPAVSFR